ncbi:MAG: 2,3,4,5-tetrahydropyridine-2,6-dicarboxylate N-succinyltransferase, partial [Alphaproteobacteria bacterium]|nr:2,3,4,5-tetrahydropyridine-2,6-dicarboxylate N-succinyltransferase [Alphaproteobacteria bacterium]
MDYRDFLRDLETGTLRAARKNEKGEWKVDATVKQRILDYFAAHELAEMGSAANPQYIGFVDKEGLNPRRFTPADRVRLIPGGASVRAGAFISPKVVIMPPSYVNIGAYVDEGSMIDSNALVGSCAQIGKRVHISAGAQIGGVLEPIGQMPVIIEDDVFVGACSAVLEGVYVGQGAVIAAGTILSGSVPIYDTVKHT